MNLSDKTTRTLIYAFGFLLFCYTLTRACLLSFTWDESYTYLEFVRHPNWFPQVINNMSANDHLLNTWMMKVCAGLFGISEFSLRLPNLFAHVLYISFSIFLVNIFNHNSNKILAFVLLNFNPYLLDFFSAARGYGMSMGFMMAALYFLVSFFAKEKKFIPALLSILSAFLALLANLTLFPIFLFLSLILVFFLLLDLAKKKKRLQLVLQPAVLVLIVIEIIQFLLPYSLKLKESGALFFGGTDNYFTDTLVSLMQCSLYEKGYLLPLAFLLSILALIFILLSLVAIIRVLLKKEFTKADLFFVSVLLLTLFSMFTSVVQHYWMGIRFPMQRTALYLLPLFALLLTYVISKFNDVKRNKLLSGIIVTLALLNFLSAFNLRSLVDWREEAEIETAMNYLNKDHTPVFQGRSNITIGTGILFDPPINYYRTKNEWGWLNLADYEDSGELCDYYLADKLGMAKLKHVKLIRSFSDELFLFKNDLKHQERILVEPKLNFDGLSETDKYSRGISNAYFNSWPYSAYTDSICQFSKGFEYVFQDSTIGRNITVSFNAAVLAGHFDFDGRLVISFEHSDGAIYSWKGMDIRDQVVTYGKWMKVNYTRYADKELKAGDRLKIYLWNYGGSPIYMDDIEMHIIHSK